MPNCTDCAHCKLDDLWGDYKCLARCTYIYSMEKYLDCEFFKKKEENKNEA